MSMDGHYRPYVDAFIDELAKEKASDLSVEFSLGLYRLLSDVGVKKSDAAFDLVPSMASVFEHDRIKFFRSEMKKRFEEILAGSTGDEAQDI